MAIYIKGMKMPKDCQYCPCCKWKHNGDGILGCLAKNNYFTEMELCHEGKPSWCPLTEVLKAKTDGDLISRADAIKAFSVYNGKRIPEVDCDNFPIEIPIKQVKDTIRSLPSADRPQGEWKHTITMQPYCSNCEYVFGEDEEFSPFWNYCPMCGARIKGGDSE